MKELVLGSAPRLSLEVLEDNREEPLDNVEESQEQNLAQVAQMRAAFGGENEVPPTPKVPTAPRGRDWPIENKTEALPFKDGGKTMEEEETDDKLDEKYALENAPPPIKIRREGETSEDPCPSPPPSPKRMRELSRKDAIHSLPFSKVFSQGSI